MRVPALNVHFPSDDLSLRDLAAAQLDGTDATAIDDADNCHWRVFYSTREARDSARALFEPFAHAHGLITSRLEVEDGDWARRSQAQLRAIRVGDIIVAPPWDLPPTRVTSPEAPSRGTNPEAPSRGTSPEAPSRGTNPEAPSRGTNPEAPPEVRGTRPEVLIVIEPSLGFGTGHHASTRLCLRAMQALDLRGKSVMDVGTGSGVLAIAAVKLGAARVTAIDTDTDAVASARENGARNDVVVDWQTADVAAARQSSFDVVLANLTGAWLRRLAEPLLGLAGGAGILVLSGLQISERDRVLEAFAGSSRLERELDEEGWTALVIVHN